MWPLNITMALAARGPERVTPVFAIALACAFAIAIAVTWMLGGSSQCLVALSSPLEVATWNDDYGSSDAGAGYPWLREAGLVEPWRET
ncbi:MAG: hypothetical protein AAGA91_20885, partial [Pseudomonadota bacterium]